jgi:hypothetical protein
MDILESAGRLSSSSGGSSCEEDGEVIGESLSTNNPLDKSERKKTKKAAIGSFQTNLERTVDI